MIIEWRPVVGWEGEYEVCNAGEVQSLDRIVAVAAPGFGPRRVRGKKLSPAPSADGHLHVNLYRLGKQYTRLVHDLVLEAFDCPRPPGMEGCHGNNNPADNWIDNLRWDTHAGNCHDRVEPRLTHRDTPVTVRP